MEEENEESKVWYQASFRLFCPNLAPEAITKLLGIRPSRTGTKGQYYQGNPQYGKIKKNYWTFDLTTNSEIPFQSQLRQALKRFSKCKPALAQLRENKENKIEFFLGYSSETGVGGFNLSADLIKEIGDWGIDLSLELFPKNIYDEKKARIFQNELREHINFRLGKEKKDTRPPKSKAKDKVT